MTLEEFRFVTTPKPAEMSNMKRFVLAYELAKKRNSAAGNALARKMAKMFRQYIDDRVAVHRRQWDKWRDGRDN